MRLAVALVVVVLGSAAGSYALLGGAAADAPAPVVDRTGSPIRLADCTQWRAGSRRERLFVVDRLGDHFGRRTAIWDGARLREGVAYATLDRACSAREARSIRLYKIYARALAFGAPTR